MNTQSLKTLAAAASFGLLIGAAHAAPTINPDRAQLGRLCSSCGFISEVHTESRQGKASGVGVVGGAVVGGLLGNRVGGGSGRALMTLGGAAAGGYAGNQIEKNSNKHTVWVVHMVYRDGSRHTRELGYDPQLRGGDVVRMQDGRLNRQ